MTTKAAERAAHEIALAVPGMEKFSPKNDLPAKVAVAIDELAGNLAKIIDREAKLPELLAVAKAANAYIEGDGTKVDVAFALAALGDLEELG